MSPPTPHLTIFGSTGGSAFSVLVRALNNQIPTNCLVRTPQKLTSMLQERGIPQSTVDKYLTITPGSITDIDAVKASLLHNPEEKTDSGAVRGGDEKDGKILADMILSGIGSLPTFLTEMTLCTDAVKMILQALESIQTTTMSPIQGTQKPRLAIISTTGISSLKRDVPWLFVPLYHLLGFRPHADKRNMEKAIRNYWKETPEKERVISGQMIVRASLLTNGKECGMGSIRSGTDEDPAIGYTISREDVGLWVFENAVRKEWEGAQGPFCITY